MTPPKFPFSTTRLRHFLLFLLLPVCLCYAVLTPIHAQQIYKWIDDNGNVHYSDRPEPDAQAEHIFIKPHPNSRSNEGPDEAIKRMEATSNELETSRQQRETARAKEQEKNNARKQNKTRNKKKNRTKEKAIAIAGTTVAIHNGHLFSPPSGLQ